MSPTLRRPPAIRPGERVALVAPASPFDPQEFDRGVAEIERLGFVPAFDERVFARTGYLAGPAALRASALRDAWRDPDIAAIIAVRGGYGSVQLLPFLDPAEMTARPKIFIGYSDTTSLLIYLARCGIVALHGPMLEGRLARGTEGYDRQSFLRALTGEPAGELSAETVSVLKAGEASGPLFGGTLTQILASLSTPFAFDPPQGFILFVDEVGERPYRLDRMLTQLRLSGLMGRAAAMVFGELPRCDEPGGAVKARDVIRDVLADFPGPVLLGFPSGHTSGPALTLPFGVDVRVVSGRRPGLVFDEAATE